uniref:Uncharacterized protein n=1 Tax=Anopheles merus TaxID=30066 RepID=A0A182VJE2_ANOME
MERSAPCKLVSIKCSCNAAPDGLLDNAVEEMCTTQAEEADGDEDEEEEEADGEEQQVGSSSGSTLFLSSSSCNDSGCTLPTQSLPAIVARQEDTTGDSTEELRPDDPSWPNSTGGGSVVAAADESLRASAFVPTTMVDAGSVPPLHGWYPPYFRSFELVRRWRSMLFESSISDLIPPRIPLGPLGSTTPDPASAPGARFSRFRSRELVREWPFPYFDSSSSFRSLECFMLFSFAPDIPPQPATAPMLLFFSTATSCEKELFRDEPPPVTRAPVELRNFTAPAAAAAVAELHVLRATARARLQMVQDVAYVASAARRQRGRLFAGTVVVLLQRNPSPEMAGRGRLLLRLLLMAMSCELLRVWCRMNRFSFQSWKSTSRLVAELLRWILISQELLR